MITYEEICDKVENERISLDYLSQLECKGVHNFSMPTMETYFYLSDMMEHKKKPLLLVENIFILPSKQGRYKTFLFNKTSPAALPLLEWLRKIGPIYSIDPIEGMKGESKFKEVGYNLDKVFDPNEYPNAKKRYQKIVYPFKQLEKFGIIEKMSTAEEVKELHDEWAKRKLEHPDTFKMMFPNKRYYECYLQSGSKDVRAYTFYMGDKLIAVRVVGVQKDLVVDLANFGRVWDMPSNCMNYLDTYVLKKLHSEGFKHFNCGAGLNKKLTLFKKHYPSYDIISYAYSKIKDEKRKENTTDTTETSD